MSNSALLHTTIPGLPLVRGKVRDVYDLGDRLLFVASDRISAFDWVLPNGIPDKGCVLTQISNNWFDRLDHPNHVLAKSVDDLELPDGIDQTMLEGRSVIVRKAKVVPVECVVRGYLSGSGWKDYQRSRSVSGVALPDGLTESDRLPEPIFTPSTKANEGHDEPISFEQVVELVGAELAERLRETSIRLYSQGAEYAESKGLILADTKFEFGLAGDELLLVDEVLTPDSSRFWPADQYEPGRGQPSFDKQFVRDWLSSTDWDKNSEPPQLPDDIVAKTREKYVEAYRLLVGREFPWT